MKNKIIIFSVLILSLFSCVDIIDLDIESSDPHPVIEAYIDNDTYAMVSVTMSASYDGVVDYNQVDAIVTLYDDQDNVDTLQYVDALGYYQSVSLVGEINTSYTLDVQIDTSHFTAESSISSPVVIDSINCDYNLQMSQLLQSMGMEEEVDGEPFYDSIYNISVYYTDPALEENYYLMRLSHNGVINTGYSLSSDKNSDGEVSYGLFMEGLALSDTVQMLLYSIDEGAYTYYDGLSDLGNSDIPYNPYSNIEGDIEVLGFFAARFVAYQEFIVRDKAVFPVLSIDN